MLTSQLTQGRLMNGVLFSEVHLFLINLFYCVTMEKMLVRYSTYDNLVMMHSVDHAVSLLFDIKDVRKREGKKPLPLPTVPVY